jgi:RHS repeat-associated protein
LKQPDTLAIHGYFIAKLSGFSLLCLFLLMSTVIAAVDKSSTRNGLISLPTPGGTIQEETGSISLQRNLGTASFVLPLPLLPNRAGFNPEISLRYDQRAADSGSGFGIGWSLSVPAITIRSGTGLPYPRDSTTDLPGNPLTLRGTTLVETDRQGEMVLFSYREHDQDIRFIYHTQSYRVAHARAVGGIFPEITSGFEVIYPDGRRELFSGDPTIAEGGGGITTSYPLAFQIHPNGESIAYRYHQSDGHAYLDEVIFAGGKSRYQFERVLNAAHTTRYNNGFRQISTFLVSRIVASFDHAIHAQWCLAYTLRQKDLALPSVEFETSPFCRDAVKKSLFADISDVGISTFPELRAVYRFGNQEVLLPSSAQFSPIRFDYSSWSEDALNRRDLVYSAPSLAGYQMLETADYEVADVNLDGMVDVIKREHPGKTLVFRGSGTLDKLYESPEPWILRRDGREIAPNMRSDRFFFVDINGDSLADVAEFDDNQLHFYLGSRGGDYSWDSEASILVRDLPSKSRFNNGSAMFVDLNGDGRSDVLETGLDSNGNTEWVVHLNKIRIESDGKRRELEVLRFQFPWRISAIDLLSRDDYRILDINGDRLPEFIVLNGNYRGLCVYDNTGVWQNRKNQGLLFASNVAVGDSRCSGAGRFIELDGIPSRKALLNLQPVDVNGDGVLDLATGASRRDQLLVWIGAGDLASFSAPLELDLNSFLTVADAKNSRSRVADVDGDGQAEVAVLQSIAPRGQKSLVVDFNRTTEQSLVKPGLLTTVRFDSGLRYDIRYATNTDEFLRDEHLGIPHSPLHFPTVVVKQLVESYGAPGDPRGYAQTTELFYSAPDFDVRDKSFKGFGRVDSLVYGDEFQGDSATGETLMTMEEFHTSVEADGVLVGRLKHRRKYSVANDADLIDSTRKTWSLNPNEPTLHSLSVQTQKQQRPVSQRLIQFNKIRWDAIDRGNDTWFIRKSSERSENYATSGTKTAASVIETRNLGHDEHNLPQRIETEHGAVQGPQGETIPSFLRELEIDYAKARTSLAALGILNLPSREIERGGDIPLSDISYEYDPVTGNLVAETRCRVSRLDSVPGALANQFLFESERRLKYEYDQVGNRTSVADQIGVIEEVDYNKPLLIFPVEHRYPNPNVLELTQITKLTYGGAVPAGRLEGYTNSLGLTYRFEYDSLGRRTRLLRGDGSEESYGYRIGKDGNPDLLIAGIKRYMTAEEVPDGETQWLRRIRAYRPDGLMVAEVEDVSVKPGVNSVALPAAVRVLELRRFNRNKQEIERFTPFFISSLNGDPAPLIGQITQNATGCPTERNKTIDLCKLFQFGHIPERGVISRHRYAYDALGRMRLRQDVSGKRVELSYYPWGKRAVSKYQDLHNGEVVHVRDDIGTLSGVFGIAEQDGNNPHERHLTRFERDAAARLSLIWLPEESQPRRVIYDSAGLLEFQKIPGLGEQYRVHDIRGNEVARLLISAIGKQHLIEWRYDTLDRLVELKVDGQRQASYQYDHYTTGYSIPTNLELDTITQPLGLVTEIESECPDTCGRHIEHIIYDGQGRSLHREIEIVGSTFWQQIHRTLDGTERYSKNSFGLEIEKLAGASGRVFSIGIDAPGIGKEKIIEGISYNASGQVGHIDYRQGAFTQLHYDEKTLLLDGIHSGYQANGQVKDLQRLEISLNSLGSVNAIHDLAGISDFGHVDRGGEFHYNWKDELKRSQRYGENLEFDYSAAGVFKQRDIQPNPATGPPVTHLIPRGNELTSYDFDGFGRLKSSPRIQNAQFDGLGRLIETLSIDGRLSYGYNANHERVFKALTYQDVEGKSPEVTLFPMRGIEMGPSGARISHVFLGDRRIARIEHDTGRWFYYLQDQLGSTDFVMNASGLPVEQFFYRPYGEEFEVTADSTDWLDYLDQYDELRPTAPVRYRYIGKPLDTETDLLYLGQRYYDPALRRFISPDPLILNDPAICLERHRECNLYGYAVNNPLKYVDDTGELAVMTVLAVGWAITEMALSSYDVYDTTKTVLDPNTSDEDKLLSVGGFLIGAIAPGGGYGPAAKGVSRTVKNSSSVTKRVGKFDVGPYNQIRGTVPGLDAHHAGQKASMKKLVEGYDLNTAPAILVPKVGHTIKGPNGIVSRGTNGIDNARDLLARDIKELRRVYPDAPNSQLQNLINLNKEMYPSAFQK